MDAESDNLIHSVSPASTLPGYPHSSAARPSHRDSRGRIHRPDQVRQRGLVGTLYIDIGGCQDPIRDLARRQRLCDCPEGIHDATVDGAALEPWIGLSALH